MKPEDKHRLCLNWTYLEANLEADAVVELCMDNLVLGPIDRQRIKAEKSRPDRALKLLSVLMGKDDDTVYNKLLKALEDAGQPELCKRLQDMVVPPQVLEQETAERMHHQGHFVKMRRPTGPEFRLCEDASHILDELLKIQLNDQRKPHGRPPRHKTYPMCSQRPRDTSGEVLDERDEAGLEGGVARFKTMPSLVRQHSMDEALFPKDLEALKKKGDKHNRLTDSSTSWADTEGDSASVTENRKKKGLLRRAKDRLKHGFHRKEREKENSLKGTDGPEVSPKEHAKKAPGQKASADHIDVKDKGSKCDGVRDGKGATQSSQTESYGKRRNSTGKLFNSILKSFRSKKKDRRGRSSSIQDDDKHPSAASSSGTSQRPQDQGTPPPPPPPPHPSSTSPNPRSLLPPAARPHHPPHPPPHHPYGDAPHLGSGGVSKNVLDDPGDDIEFIDMEGEAGGDGTVQSGYGEAVVGYGGRASGRKDEEVSDGRKRPIFRQQSSVCVDGDTDTPDGKGRPPESTEDIPNHERTAEEKEEMYGEIAQKLILIGDSFAPNGQGDAEAHHHREGAAAAASLGLEGDGVLSELERQIIECLRDAGDRNAPMIENQAEAVIQLRKAQMYERFKATVQWSLGNEVSWNHLVILFYTTSWVMSRMGLGSKMAGDIKEMVLCYFFDKFAKWLMDHGGFEVLLSESDSELD